MDHYDFNGIGFVLIMPGSRETPHWKVTVDATDRTLIGTDRFERTIRSRQYAIEGELWIEPTDDPATARDHWILLQDAYSTGLAATLTTPTGNTATVVLTTFEVRPVTGGADGYRGKVVFGLPGGRTG
jgi:hypothetical protein